MNKLQTVVSKLQQKSWYNTNPKQNQQQQQQQNLSTIDEINSDTTSKDEDEPEEFVNFPNDTNLVETEEDKEDIWNQADADYYCESDEDEELEEENAILEKTMQEEVYPETEALENNGGWTKKTANEFQSCLMTLLHFVLGAQRKQILEGFTIKVRKIVNLYLYLIN
jgi:hypothetical protein